MRRGDLTPWGLTPRMVQILDTLAEGATNAEVGERMGISSRTVEFVLGTVRDRMEDADGVRPSGRTALLIAWIGYRNARPV